jgi:hypothetical protein
LDRFTVGQSSEFVSGRTRQYPHQLSTEVIQALRSHSFVELELTVLQKVLAFQLLARPTMHAAARIVALVRATMCSKRLIIGSARHPRGASKPEDCLVVQYKKAQEALQKLEDMTFSDSEIDAFLPKELKRGQSPT